MDKKGSYNNLNITLMVLLSGASGETQRLVVCAAVKIGIGIGLHVINGKGVDAGMELVFGGKTMTRVGSSKKILNRVLNIAKMQFPFPSRKRKRQEKKCVSCLITRPFRPFCIDQ